MVECHLLSVIVRQRLGFPDLPEPVDKTLRRSARLVNQPILKESKVGRETIEHLTTDIPLEVSLAVTIGILVFDLDDRIVPPLIGPSHVKAKCALPRRPVGEWDEARSTQVDWFLPS